MSFLLSAELSAACNALGSYDPVADQYFSDDNILETVKDLIRYLRRDTDSHEIRRQLGAANIVQINLIPLLKLYWQQNDLFDVLLRLLGNLTSPVLILYNEEIPKDRTFRNQFMQILGHLQSYKEAFADCDLWGVLSTKLSQLLSTEWQERGEENGLIIERILILVRNVLNVPADANIERRPDNDVSAHDKVIWSLRQSGLTDILLYMVNSEQEEPYYMYLLEILLLVLREHRPIDVANVNVTRTESDKVLDEMEFLVVRQREMNRRAESLKRYTSARHSQFGGTYVIKNMKSVNDNQELIYHKPLNKLNMLDFDADKSKVKIPKNRVPLHEANASRRSTHSIRLLLKELCIEFLNAGYNHLMYNVRRKLVRGKSLTQDGSYYLMALKFFMEFNRYHNFDLKLVSETMSIEIFHYVQQQMEHNFDMLTSDKEKWRLWSKRLHIALQAYRELLLTLNTMDKSLDNSIKDPSKIIKSNVFYVIEYREFILTLMLTYNSVKMSDAYLLDLIETQDIFMKMLQSYCGQDNSVIVQKRQRAKRKKKSQQASDTTPADDLENKWDEIAPQLSSILETNENIPVVVPFDATSDIPIDEQRKGAMINIQNYLRANEIENAFGMLRASREVWPENDAFGSNLMSAEDEFLAIKDIFFAELQDHSVAQNIPNENEEEDEEDEEDIDDAIDLQVEVEFKFHDFIKRFAHPKIVHACAIALRRFNLNSVSVNHSIIKLLHRISWDCKMSAMIFQASIFRSFQRIFMERDKPKYKELVKFATYIIRQFVHVTEKNPKIYVELLFWKNSREAFEVEEGYGSYEKASKAMKAIWTEQEEDELRLLYMEYRKKDIQEDVIDWLLEHLIDNTKSRRMIIKKLKALMLLDYKGRKKGDASRPPPDWSEPEIMQLTELYNKYKNASDPLTGILEGLDVKRPKVRVIDKLLALNLISDRKELRKKRQSKYTSDVSIQYTSNEFVNSSENGSSDEDEPLVRNTVPRNINLTMRSVKPTKRNIFQPNLTNTNALRKLISIVVNKGLTDSLKWLEENLSEAAEDFSPDDKEGVPLVPIAASEISAMEDSSFKEMLLAMGIVQPADEQEIYWRIHTSRAENLLQLSTIIKEVLDGKLIDNNELVTEEPDSSDEDVFDRLRTFVSKSDDEEIQINQPAEIRELSKNRKQVINKSKTSNVKIRLEENLEEGNNDKPTEANANTSQALRDSDESDEELSKNINTNRNHKNNLGSTNSAKKLSSNRRLRILDESGESDVEMRDDESHSQEKGISELAISKANVEKSENSDDESRTNTNVKRNRGSYSDSDSNQHNVKRKRFVIDSDED